MGERKHVTRESGHTIRLETQLKRGTDTRDQDVIKVKVRGDDPSETAARLKATVMALNDRDTPDELRAIQPGESDE